MATRRTSERGAEDAEGVVLAHRARVAGDVAVRLREPGDRLQVGKTVMELS